MTGNLRLKIAMAERGFQQAELAQAVNAELLTAGERDSVGDRTVRTWLTGKTTWPHRAKRNALEAVFRCTVETLGFYPPGSPAPPQEDPEVIRRRFLADAAGTAAAAIPLVSVRPSSVGTSDVIRLRDSIERLIALDDERGGHTTLERAALAGAAEALELQRRSTTQRVRARLFALASDFTSTAAWSLIDAGQLDGASRHLDRALTLAVMVQDPEMTMKVWNLRAMLARQQNDFAEAVAAAQAAQATWAARRSPLHASLAHARTAVGLANAGDRRAALRSLGHAEDAMAKADTTAPRPAWIAFYSLAELHSLTAIVRDRVGDPAEAEAASYRALAALPETYRRNRAHTTARLALSQLHQGDIEQACDTSAEVFEIMAGDPLPGRMRQLLGDFHRDLITLAPSRIAHEWANRYRTEWSTA
ncbi:XRE family transcriptional regulator [Streptomyces shenzhenensis]